MNSRCFSKLFLCFLFGGMLVLPSALRATFSIVAVDTVNGIVGGAGASCIAGSQMINDVVEGIGAVHTQAWYLEGNQDNAHALLLDGLDPDSIISWLANNDVEGTPEMRQYLVVTLAGPGSSAAYTGSSTSYWAGHATGPGYSIAGNILLGPEIVADMETAFLTTEGELEDKLMAALEAANVPGADTRCTSCQKPAISAFIRVRRPGDSEYLYRVVNNTICSQNPIDSLKVLYDSWVTLKYAHADFSTAEIVPELIVAKCPDSAVLTITPLNRVGIAPIAGIDEIVLTNSGDGTISPVTDNGDGTFTAYVIAPETAGQDTISVTIIAGGEAVEITDHPTLEYILIGDTNGDGTINILDITYLIAYLYKGGAAPVPEWRADSNGDTNVNILDITYLISYLYKLGPDPQCP